MWRRRLSQALLIIAGVATLASAGFAVGARSDERLIDVGSAALRADFRAKDPEPGARLVGVREPLLEPLLSHLRGWTSMLYSMTSEELEQLSGICADATCSEDADIEVRFVDEGYRLEHWTSRAWLEYRVGQHRGRIIELARGSRASFRLWALRIASGLACLLLAIALRQRWPWTRAFAGCLGVVLLAETTATLLALSETLHFLGYLDSMPRLIAEPAAIGVSSICVIICFLSRRRAAAASSDKTGTTAISPGRLAESISWVEGRAESAALARIERLVGRRLGRLRAGPRGSVPEDRCHPSDVPDAVDAWRTGVAEGPDARALLHCHSSQH